MIQRKPLTAFLFLLPALAVYVLIVIYPLFQGAFLSLTDSKVGNAGNFVGAENYRELVGDTEVMRALGVTLAYAAVVVVVQNGLGLLLARALFNRMRIRRLVSLLILLPTLMSAVMPAFAALFAQEGGDWVKFYAAVEKLGGLPVEQRKAALRQLEGGSR